MQYADNPREYTRRLDRFYQFSDEQKMTRWQRRHSRDAFIDMHDFQGTEDEARELISKSLTLSIGSLFAWFWPSAVSALLQLLLNYWLARVKQPATP